MPRTRSDGLRRGEARRLKRLREALGYSQREMAADFGVAPAAVAQWEASSRTLPGPVLKLMALYERELGLGRPQDERELTALRESWISRSLSLSRTAAGAAAVVAAATLDRVISREQAGPIARRAQHAVARRFAERLGELKGLAMKVGQMLSYLDHAVPPAARAALATLQTTSTPMAAPVVAEVVLEDLGQTPRQLFAHWDPVPMAAASIGQVHRARLRDGIAVAVKVQYPGVVRAIEADLRSATVLDQLASLLFPGQERGAMISELRARLREECDYRIEAANQEEFRRLHAGVAGIRVPRVHLALSSRRVLTTDLASGAPLADFVARASQRERDRAGELIFDVAMGSLFRHALFNGDPHPGNFLFRRGEVVFLDFGCCKRLPAALVVGWKRILGAVFARNWAEHDRLLRQLGFVGDPKRFDYRDHRELVLVLNRPWLEEGPFRFDDDFLQGVWAKMTVENVNRAHTNIPGDWLLINRLQLGTFALLCRLRARSDWRIRMRALLEA